jgi:hypothetical protein
MEVGHGPNLGCSAKGKKMKRRYIIDVSILEYLI